MQEDWQVEEFENEQSRGKKRMEGNENEQYYWKEFQKLNSQRELRMHWKRDTLFMMLICNSSYFGTAVLPF